jgi:hypothetical protein
VPVVKVLSNEASAGTVLNSEECQTYLTKLWGNKVVGRGRQDASAYDKSSSGGKARAGFSE